jgi:hypothetical protein
MCSEKPSFGSADPIPSMYRTWAPNRQAVVSENVHQTAETLIARSARARLKHDAGSEVALYYGTRVYAKENQGRETPIEMSSAPRRLDLLRLPIRA